jgi:hypothetical protein
VGTTSDKLTYLNITKTKIKDAINLANTNITNETFRQYESKIKQALINTMNDKWGTWANFEKVTGTGETLTLNNTAEAPMKIDLKGNTSQYSTTGKNMLKIKYTVDRGITTTINNDGSIKASGTATDTLAYLDTGENVSLKAGKYYLSLASAISVNLRLFLYNGGTQIGTMTLNAGGTTTSTTTTQTITSYSLIIYGLTTNTNYNIILKPQLEKNDSSATSWEPYTNGASPNPTYPQDVNVVSGDNTIEVVGKNLLENTASSKTESDVIWTVNSDKTITVSGTASDFTTLLVGTAYVNSSMGNIVISGLEGTTNIVFYAMYLYDKDDNSIATIAGSSETENTNISFDLSSYTNAHHILYRVKRKSNGAVSGTIEPMIELGNQSSTYQPYTSQTQLISLGSIELCKIGDYQDRPFKAVNGDDFYDTLDSATKQTLTYGK